MEVRSIRTRSVKLIMGGSLIFGSLLAACGDKSSDPDAADLNDLKYPGDLRIQDSGNGSIQLSWQGTNNESDFDGYNIYGQKKSLIQTELNNLGLKEGESLQLLDDRGDPRNAAKSFLARFNYDYDAPFTKVGEASADAKSEFTYLPIHGKQLDGTPALPTCKPTRNGECKLHNDDTIGQSTTLNGRTHFNITNLTPGEEYCFIVLSSMNKGEDVSQSSSEFRCVTPKFKATASLSGKNAAEAGRSTAIELGALRTACAAGTGASPCPSVTVDSTTIVTRNSTIVPTPITSGFTAPVYMEFISGNLFLTAGVNAAVADLGYRTGFSDASLPALAPAIRSFDAVQVKDGYSIPGESIPLRANHMYVVAAGGTGTTDFHYYWLHVSGLDASPSADNINTATVTFEVRLPSAVNER